MTDEANSLIPENPNKIKFRFVVEQNRYANLDISLLQTGFFSISTYRGNQKNPRQEKTLSIKTRNFIEQGVKVRAEIITPRKYGIPTTEDLTLWIAFLQILYVNFFDGEKITQPIFFKGSELLKRASGTAGGNRFEVVRDWLLRMQNTQIHLYGKFDGTKKDQLTATSVFSDVKIYGNVDEGGDELKFNMVWLSDWMLKNIQNHFPLIINFETYKKVKNQTARLLIVHLQIWLYASRKNSYFEKDYVDFCNLLGLTVCKYESDIEKQLGKAFEELEKFGYTENWKIVKKLGGNGLKILIKSGKKLEEDSRDISKLFAEKKKPPVDLDLNLPSAANQPTGKVNLGELSTEQREVYDYLRKLKLYEESAFHLVKRRPLDRLRRQIADAELKAEKKELNEGIGSKAGYIWQILKRDEETEDIPTSSADATGFAADEQDGFDGDIEAIKADWLRKEYDAFCLEEARRAARPNFKSFEKDYRAGQVIWEKALAEIEKSLNRQIFDAWFKPMTFGGFDDAEKTFYLIASKVNKDWVTTYYQETITAALTKLDAGDHKLSWIVVEATFTDAPAVVPDVQFCFERKLISDYQSNGTSFDDFCAFYQPDLEKRFLAYLETDEAKEKMFRL